MAVTIHVNGTSNSLVHKGSGGFAKNTLPDVCKTPSPGGPVPIPYPVIVSMSSDLKKGTKTVKVDGGNMAAIKGSEFSRCSGDEAGTAGGVRSSTNMKEATWITSSPDVKLDGKNACRLSDKMQMNHGNTVCLAGIQQIPVLAPPLEGQEECTVACAIICCDKAKYKKTPHADSGTKKGSTLDCTSLSTTKHSCVLHSLREKTESGNLTTTNKFDNIQASPQMTALGKPVVPDIVVNGNHVIDCKFPCDKTKPNAPLNMQPCESARISTKGKGSMPTPKEDTVYPEIDGMEEANVEGMTPLDAENRMKDNDCPDCDCTYEDA